MFGFRVEVNGNVEESLNYINGIAKFTSCTVYCRTGGFRARRA
jgi:hypothetical protein